MEVGDGMCGGEVRRERYGGKKETEKKGKGEVGREVIFFFRAEDGIRDRVM